MNSPTRKVSKNYFFDIFFAFLVLVFLNPVCYYVLVRNPRLLFRSGYVRCFIIPTQPVICNSISHIYENLFDFILTFEYECIILCSYEH